MQEYMSKTDRIQGCIREFLADEKKHSTKEIIEYVDSKLKENGEFVFQVNSYVNAAMEECLLLLFFKGRGIGTDKF